MALWDFRRESTQLATGANTVAGRVKGYQAPFVAGDATEMAEKRNVIATSAGWIRRENRGTRTIDQVIVAANPGITNVDYTSNTFLGKPDIAQIYVKLNASGVIAANTSTANLYVVFNTPLTFKPSGNLCSITVSNTSGGNAAVARFANTVAQGRIVNANNTLVFRLPPLQANGQLNITFPNDTITGTVANTAFTVDGVAFDSTAVDIIAAANGSQLATELADSPQLTGAVWNLSTLTLTLYAPQSAGFVVTGNTAFVNSTSGDIVGETDTVSGQATYAVGAQAISVTGMPLYNPDDGITSSANLVITGAVSNNLLNGIGQRVATFTVRIGG
jgi:hypothetical protein